MTQLQPITAPLHPDAFDEVELTLHDLLLHYDTHTISCQDGSSFYCASPTQIFNLESEHDSICITDTLERVYIEYDAFRSNPIYTKLTFESGHFRREISLSECTKLFQFVPIWPRE
jgi:hypothetical protein